MANTTKSTKQTQDTARVLDKAAKVFESGTVLLNSAQSIAMMIAGMVEANRVAQEQKRQQQKPTAYQILGVDEYASNEEIKAIFRTKIKFYHPDNGGNADTFRMIKAAYEQIKEERGIL